MSTARPMPAILLFLVPLVLLLQGGVAAAHPHVWITSITSFVFEGPSWSACAIAGSSTSSSAPT